MKEQIVVKGKDIVLPVTFESTSCPSIAWTKDGQNILESNRLTIKKDGTSTELRISAAVESDAGSYQLVLKNNAGEVKSSCNVVVHGKYKLYLNLSDSLSIFK